MMENFRWAVLFALLNNPFTMKMGTSSLIFFTYVIVLKEEVE
ncbi:hypothetical protein ACFVQB_28750 [Paenibacillus sp. NPDC057886]